MQPTERERKPTHQVRVLGTLPRRLPCDLPLFFHGEHGKDDGFGRADGRNSRGVGSGLDGGVKELCDHGHRAVLEVHGGGVLLCVNEVDVRVLSRRVKASGRTSGTDGVGGGGRMGNDARGQLTSRVFLHEIVVLTHLLHELLDLWLHVGRHERGQVERGGSARHNDLRFSPRLVRSSISSLAIPEREGRDSPVQLKLVLDLRGAKKEKKEGRFSDYRGSFARRNDLRLDSSALPPSLLLRTTAA